MADIFYSTERNIFKSFFCANLELFDDPDIELKDNITNSFGVSEGRRKSFFVHPSAQTAITPTMPGHVPLHLPLPRVKHRTCR